MNNTQICPIDTHITQIINSSTSKTSTLRTLNALETIISGLLSTPLQYNYKTLHREDPVLSQDISTATIHEFLTFIGYNENQGVYTHDTRDETLKLLEDAQKVLKYRISQYNLIQTYEQYSTQTITDNEAQTTQASIDMKPKKKECMIKSFLMKHLKKDQADLSMSNKYQNRRPCSDFMFNSEGYFHQSASSNGSEGSMRKKEAKRDLFEEHEKGMKTKKSCIFSFMKRN